MLCRKLLVSTTRCLQTAARANAKPKSMVIANIDTHEFHKVIKWKRPEKLVPWDPRRSGDLRQLEPVDPSWLRKEYRPFADIINELPSEHRKIFTVEFGKLNAGQVLLLEDTLEKTRRHKHDYSSLEYKVTKSTWRIRCIQEDFRQFPKLVERGFLRKQVKELVEKRLKYLNKMRQQDYKRFEWIIEVLGLVYKLTPVHTRVERKASVNVLVNLFCNEIRDQKMAEYKAQLETEKVPFLKRKLETLHAIREDELSVGISSTVDDDIRKTRSFLQELEKSKGPDMMIHPIKVECPVDSNTAISRMYTYFD